jgi:hypothetical protein
MEAMHIVSSRAFDINVDSTTNSAMIPFVDMMNHAKFQETNWYFEEENGHLIVDAREDIKKGD